MKKIFLACLISVASLHAMELTAFEKLSNLNKIDLRTHIYDPIANRERSDKTNKFQLHPVPYFDKNRYGKGDAGLVNFKKERPQQATLIATFYEYLLSKKSYFVEELVKPNLDETLYALLISRGDLQNISSVAQEFYKFLKPEHNTDFFKNKYNTLITQFLCNLTTYCKDKGSEELEKLDQKFQEIKENKWSGRSEREFSERSFGSDTLSQQDIKYDHEQKNPYSRESSKKFLERETHFYGNEENYKERYLAEQKKVGELELKIQLLERAREREREEEHTQYESLNKRLQKELREKGSERHSKPSREEPNHTNSLLLTIPVLENQLNTNTGTENRSTMEDIYGMLFKAEPQSLEFFRPLLKKMASVNKVFYDKKACDANEKDFSPTIVMNLKSYLQHTGKKSNKALETLKALEDEAYEKIEWKAGLDLEAYSTRAKLPK